MMGGVSRVLLSGVLYSILACSLYQAIRLMLCKLCILCILCYILVDMLVDILVDIVYLYWQPDHVRHRLMTIHPDLNST